jgi:hypothetical protein
MERLSIELPALYGDHHAAEVHALLSALPGVASVYASAAWHLVQVEFDPAQIGPGGLRQALLKRGYSEDQTHVPPVSARTRDLTSFAVGPAATEQFVEHVPAWSEPAAPCPGFEIRQPGEVHPADRP